MNEAVQTNTQGPKPVLMDDIFRMLGAMQIEIEVLRRENAHLKEQLAEKQ